MPLLFRSLQGTPLANSRIVYNNLCYSQTFLLLCRNRLRLPAYNIAYHVSTRPCLLCCELYSIFAISILCKIFHFCFLLKMPPSFVLVHFKTMLLVILQIYSIYTFTKGPMTDLCRTPLTPCDISNTFHFFGHQ